MTHIRNAWYVAAWAHELEPEAPTGVTILDEPIVLWRSDGRLVALEDRCVHRLAPLSLGRCEGPSLRCMYHGLLYRPDGGVAEIPGQELVPARAQVKAYPVRERHGWVWVWMGDPARAADELIPDVVGVDHPDYLMGSGALDYAAEARLIMDNLLDFSHISYLHASTLPGGKTFADQRVKFESLPRGLRYGRWTLDFEGMIGRRPGLRVDSFSLNTYFLPGIMTIWTGSFPVGTAERYEHGIPDFDEAIAGVTFTTHAATPTIGSSSRYFYSWGPHRQHGDEKVRDFLMKIGLAAFMEDKAMIEAQQRIIDLTPDHHVMPTAQDQGVVLYNRLVEQLAASERIDDEEIA